MPSPEPIHATLRRLRIAANLTTAELAHRAGLNRTALHALECGRRKPSWEALLALATALGVSLGALEGCKPER